LSSTKIDLVALEQSTAFATLDAASKNLVTTLTAVSGHIENGLKTQTSKLVQLHDQTKAAVEDLALQDQHDHEATRAQVARLSLSAEERDAQIIIATATNGTAIELSLDQNLAEHKKTRQAMQVYKDQAERQIEQLTEQIRQLQIDLKASVKDMVSRMATASPREQQNLKEITNAKYNLWAALELMLEKLKVQPALVSLGKH
jgi:ribosomal protein S15P/S13E